MASFEDLTPYTYLTGPWVKQAAALNVGWLEGGSSFEIGPVPAGFHERLDALVRRPVNLCRGWHVCWCAKAEGNGEIRVTGADGAVYAAPVLIAHYVAAHRYRPPQAFIDAVMESPEAVGAVYAAPVLVAHYVAAHGYRPPQAFIDAVMESPEAVGAVAREGD